MQLIKFDYADGTHYCDHDVIDRKQSFGTYKEFLVVTPAGHIHYRNGFSVNNLPAEVLVAAEAECEHNKSLWEEKWNNMSWAEQYHMIVEFFDKHPVTYAEALEEDHKMTMTYGANFDYFHFVQKWKETYLAAI